MHTLQAIHTYMQYIHIYMKYIHDTYTIHAHTYILNRGFVACISVFGGYMTFYRVHICMYACIVYVFFGDFISVCISLYLHVYKGICLYDCIRPPHNSVRMYCMYRYVSYVSYVLLTYPCSICMYCM